MFRFGGYLDRKRFALAAALRVGLFAASVVGFPFVLMAAAYVTKCQGIGGACGAVALIASSIYKPLVFMVFVFSFVGIALRRARDAGMPAWIGLFVPLLFAADAAFLVFAGAHWSFAFSAGLLRGSFPRYVVLALYCIVALCLLPSREAPAGSRNPFGQAGLVAFALGIAVAVFAATNTMGLSHALLPLTALVWRAAQLAPYPMIAFAATLAWIVRQSFQLPMATPARSAPDPGAIPSRPVLVVIALALVPTFVAFTWSMPKGFAPWSAAMLLAPILVPTYLLYLTPMLAGFFAVTRRSPLGFALLALAMLPFVLWGHAHWTTAREHAREAAEIAAIPTARPGPLPDTIVFESPHVIGMDAVWKVPGVERVISKGSQTSATRLLQFERVHGARPATRRSEIASLPDAYLLLRVGRASSFAKPRQVYAAAGGGPLELRLVEPGRDDLIAVWYRAYNPRPSTLPVLTMSGWYRGSNTAPWEQTVAAIGDFLVKALARSS